MSSLFNLASATVGGGHQLRGGGYRMQRSVRLRGSAGYLNRTLGASGSTTQWTFSAWVKRGTLGTLTTIFSSCITGATYYQSVLAFDSSDRLWYYQYSNASNYTVNVTSTAVFRDPSAWYHVVMKFDANTSSMIVWVNNQQVINSSSFSTTYRYINSNNVHYIGNYAYQTVDPGKYDGYIAEVNFIDGQVLTPSSFGETNVFTGAWQAKRYTGTYGTNGFYLNFSDNSAATAAAIGKDYSGNGNNWTPNNISVTAGVTYDSMLDVPTNWADGGNGRGNYAVLNPNATYRAGNSYTLSNGNLTYTQATCTAATNVGASFILPYGSGKFYYEVTQIGKTTVGGDATTPFSLIVHDFAAAGVTYSNFSYNLQGSGAGTDPTGTSLTGVSSISNNDVVMVAIDLINGKLFLGKNGTWFNTGDPAAGTGAVATNLANYSNFVPGVGNNGGNMSNFSCALNFGQRPFSHTVPTGFKPINTQNLPTPTILRGNRYFDVALQTGNTTGRTVSGLAFQPDLVIVKNRAGSTNRRWGVIDSVRGVNKTLSTALTDAEVTSQTDLLTTFNSDGFTIGADAGLYGWNGFAESYAHFVWKEGATQGFDIVTYTGTGVARTISHSLGVKPAMMIIKNRSGVYDWPTWHQNLPNPTTQHFWLNATNAAQISGSFNSTQPTPSVFSVGTTSEANANGNNFVAYLFAEVAGFSKFGSYTGNGANDGPFVYCGFRPRWIMVKITSGGTGFWHLIDTARDTYNQNGLGLYPNSSNAESSDFASDTLSNGFKIRNTQSEINGSGFTYIFAAFAENPFKYALAR